jgi:hypothetical protein
MSRKQQPQEESEMFTLQDLHVLMSAAQLAMNKCDETGNEIIDNNSRPSTTEVNDALSNAKAILNEIDISVSFSDELEEAGAKEGDRGKSFKLKR